VTTPGFDDVPPPTPIPTARFAVPAPAGPPRSGLRARARRESWLVRFLMYGVLAVMAFGDGYGIFRTLINLLVRDTPLVALFTFALTLGAVAGAHEIGRLARHRREGRGGHPAWIALLAAFWLGVGATVAWLRITHPLTSRAGEPGTEALQFGLLLLCLYLLTGALAITTAYRFGSPREAELRGLLRERERAVRDVADHQFDYDRTERLAAHTRAETERARAEHLDQGGLEAFGVYLKERINLRQAGHLGDPQATDELRQPRP
jgi:hypothetical protein